MDCDETVSSIKYEEAPSNNVTAGSDSWKISLNVLRDSFKIIMF